MEQSEPKKSIKIKYKQLYTEEKKKTQELEYILKNKDNEINTLKILLKTKETELENIKSLSNCNKENNKEINLKCTLTKNNAAIKIQTWCRKIQLQIKLNPKEYIVKKFNANLKGKIFEKDGNNKHCGDEGNWIEKQMGIKCNGNNKPDLLGYEMKKQSIVTTFIDKAPSVFLLEENKIVKNKEDKKIFWNIFQRTNSSGIRIGGWKLDEWDNDGQSMHIDENNNIVILYNYSFDKRPEIDKILPKYYKNNKSHTIISWYKIDLENAINNKWNQKGFFVCKKNKEGIYDKIYFGNHFDFDYWLENVKQKNIYYDGYSIYGGRWRGCFRSQSKWFYKHIIEEY
jgi:hypothetical protein